MVRAAGLDWAALCRWAGTIFWDTHIIQLSEEIISRDKLTTLMATHSMMMHRGVVLHDFRGAEKQRLRPADLLARFESVRRAELLDEAAAEMRRAAYV